jgi:hypothetical protein
MTLNSSCIAGHTTSHTLANVEKGAWRFGQMVRLIRS